METRDFETAQAFLLAAKTYWTTVMFRNLKTTYEELESGIKKSADRPAKVIKALEKKVLYRYFAWLERILDMGCGFGKSTMPFVQRFPKAQIEGIDLSAPALTLAAQNARKAKLKNVHFQQMNLEKTNYDDNSFDRITSTMTLHEIPTKALKNMLDEAFRILRPGGRMVHLDFHVIPDEFQRFLHYGHSVRNNEPYMRTLADLNLEKEMSSKGFENVDLRQFAESDDLDLELNDAWRFPWTAISATKPAN